MLSEFGFTWNMLLLTNSVEKDSSKTESHRQRVVSNKNQISSVSK